MQFTTLSLSALLFTVSLAAPTLHKRECTEAELDLSWTNYDEDRDGRVLASDLVRISRATGENINLVEANALVAAWDQNGDSVLSREELTAATDICLYD